MNHDLVFAKTQEGEEAVHQRTRLVQRNLRTVLILIDGKTSVGQLISNVGSESVLVAGLEQLERDGFVRVVTGAKSSAPDGVLTSMENYLEPATDESFPSARVDEKLGGPFSAPDQGGGNPFAPASTADSYRPSTSASATPAFDDISVSPFSTAPSAKSAASASSSPFQVPSGNPFGAVVAASPSSPFGTPIALSPFGAPAQVAKSQPVQVEEEEPEVAPYVDLESPSKRRRSALFTPKSVAIAAASVLAMGGATILFFPYDNYRPEIESALTAMAGQTVKISSVNASFSPAPTLVLSQVAIGMGADGGGVSIAEIRAVPTIASLFSSKKSFSRVTLRGTQVPMAQMGMVASGLSGAGRSNAFSVSKIDIDHMTLALRDISFQDYSGRAELSQDGILKLMELHSTDGTMSIQVGPGATENEPTQVLIQGQGWKSGEGSPFVFDTLAINGQLSGSRFAAEKIEGRIFGGVIQGQLQLDWTGGMLVSGDVNVDYMSAPQLAAALGSGSITVEGQTSARVRFRASGESWSAIADKVPLEGSFIAKTGVINGMDFVEAVRRGSRLATRGGATRYEQMIGKFRWDGGTLQLSDIDISSGTVRATGNVAVVKSGQLTGSMSVVLQSSAATMRSPVAIVGTLKDPQLFGGRN